MDAPAENRVNGSLLLLGVWAIAKLRPRYGGSCEWNLVFQPPMNHIHLRRMGGDEIDQEVGVQVYHDSHQ